MPEGFRLQDVIRPLAQAEQAFMQFLTAPFQQAGMSAPPMPPGPASILSQMELPTLPGFPSPASMPGGTPLAKKSAAETSPGAGPTLPKTGGLERRGL